MKLSPVYLKYGAAFATGYVGALVPVFALGQVPEGKSLLAALGAGLVSTGLFHLPGPQAGNPSSEETAGDPGEH